MPPIAYWGCQRTNETQETGIERMRTAVADMPFARLKKFPEDV